jgi:hypothetical protein
VLGASLSLLAAVRGGTNLLAVILNLENKPGQLLPADKQMTFTDINPRSQNSASDGIAGQLSKLSIPSRFNVNGLIAATVGVLYLEEFTPSARTVAVLSQMSVHASARRGSPELGLAACLPPGDRLRRSVEMLMPVYVGGAMIWGACGRKTRQTTASAGMRCQRGQ